MLPEPILVSPADGATLALISLLLPWLSLLCYALTFLAKRRRGYFFPLCC